MLVKFHTKGYPDITMFGDIAIGLIKAMGQNGNVPSAIRAEDVPAALQKLKEALDADVDPLVSTDKGSASQEKSAESDEEDVSFSQRAIPLVELLETAKKQNSFVSWDH